MAPKIRLKPKQPKPRPKVKIEYPPVTRRKWIPPHLKPRKKREPAYVKPPGLTQKLAVSNLVKIWNQFRVVGHRGILFGDFSQNHQRFLVRHRGLQGACNCAMACVYATLIPMNYWSRITIDDILEKGDDLYHRSCLYQDDKKNTIIPIEKVYNTFYLERRKVTIVLKDPICDSITITKDPKETLTQSFDKFFQSHQTGVLSIKDRIYGFWTADAFYLFDPAERNLYGARWDGVLAGEGYATVKRFKKCEQMAEEVVSELDARSGCCYKITPCHLLRVTPFEAKPPETLYDALALGKKDPTQVYALAQQTATEVKQKKKKVEPEPPTEEPAPSVDHTELQMCDEISPEVGDDISASKKPSWLQDKPIVRPPKPKIPLLDKPRPKSVTHFKELTPSKFGVLRCNTHITDPFFSKYKGAECIAQAVAALAMRRVAPAKTWVRKTANEILKLGEIIHHDSLKASDTKTVTVNNIVKKIAVQDRYFTPEVDEYSLIGQLNSVRADVFDLLGGLRSYFKDYDCCVVTGPLTLAVWFENNSFFMFDPYERDEAGRALLNYIKLVEDDVVINDIRGAACVTWFSDLKDLVKLYLNNVEDGRRQEHFHLSRVQINDYVGIPDPWFNFEPIDAGTWILRGTFNQANHRFAPATRNTQCTTMAAMAIAYTALRPLQEWHSQTIDDILCLGDDFYKQSTDYLRCKEVLRHKMLMLDEIHRKFVLDDVEINFLIEDCVVNGMIDAKEENDVYNMRRGFMEFFKDKDTKAGVLTSHDISVAVWRDENSYYYFDSHSRDAKGMATGYGTACVMKFERLEDMVQAIEANMGPSENHLFNIGKVTIKLLEYKDGMTIPPANQYTNLDDNEYAMILRGNYSMKSDKFKLSNAKQSIPMCLVAMGMNWVRPAAVWDASTMDEILVLGDELCQKNLAELEEQHRLKVEESGGVEHENPNIIITSKNVHSDFKIGFNEFSLKFETLSEGIIRESLKKTLLNYYKTHPEISDLSNLELLLETETIKVSIWKDKEVFYVFDPMARDEYGQLIGKDDWTEVLETDSMEFGDLEGDGEEEEGEEGEVEYEGGEEEGLSFDLEEDLGDKHPPEYWAEFEKHGRACVLRFCKIEDLVKHIYENTPPSKRPCWRYTLKKVLVNNRLDVKDFYDPEIQMRPDVFAGDWYSFKEIEHGRWILSSHTAMADELYPKANRGKQQYPMCFAAIGFSLVAPMSKMSPHNLDTVMHYGDRLLTYTRRMRKQQLLENRSVNLKEEEINNLIDNEVYQISDYFRKFTVGDKKIEVNLELEKLQGDIRSPPGSTIPNLHEAMATFFQENKYGIVECKGYAVAVWKGEMMYYMFDPHRCGPNGLSNPHGFGCITRYLNLDRLVDVYLLNLPKASTNFFFIHKINVTQEEYKRPRQPEDKPKPKEPVKVGGFGDVVPGKKALRGTISQFNDKFGKNAGLMAAPIAFIALTMSLVHKCENWSKPIIDEIIELGAILYNESTERLGYRFNPWEGPLQVHAVNNDYNVGTLKANCELRNTDQRGIIDIKDPKIMNLRQGIERFFEENTHGILITRNFTLGIWEDIQDNKPMIYIYDPNQRGATGLPNPTGVACAVCFTNGKMAADHIMSCIMDPNLKKGEYTLVPVEIVVGNKRTKKKLCKGMVSTTVIPQVKKCCSKPLLRCLTKEEEKEIRKQAEAERKLKEAKRLQQLGRIEFHKLNNGEFILRGTRSQCSECYPAKSRGFQDFPTCVAAFVLSNIKPIFDWTSKEIDTVLDTGNQLYIDSYIAYSPKQKKMGPECIIRNVYMNDVKVHFTVYKPLSFESFHPKTLYMALNKFFIQKPFGIVNFLDNFIAVYLKAGLYYLFDPHDVTLEGKVALPGKGSAVVMKYEKLDAFAAKIFELLNPEELIHVPYKLYLVTNSLSKYEK